MCGIVAGTAERNVIPILMEGLRRLEYRGYDSAGVAVRHDDGIQRRRALGKVVELQNVLDASPIEGRTGIAHTRWATHGVPSEQNAHPHISGDGLAIVHNGIIENHEKLRADLIAAGYEFTSETDTEVVAHLIHQNLQTANDLEAAVRKTVAELHGAYALVVMSRDEPGKLILAREGCPVVIGVGIGENFVASDVAALLPVTRKFMFLEEGDIAIVTREGVQVSDLAGNVVERPVNESELTADSVERGRFRHYMQKEIHEQARAVADTLSERIADGRVLDAALGPTAGNVLQQTKAVQIVACGTSYHAGLIARYWIEEHCGIPCRVEIASEYRYRKVVIPENCLFVTISQSGETADTLAALRKAKENGYLATLTVCNVPESSLVRESELALMTRAGPEIGVASTKAFISQLAALFLFTLYLAQIKETVPLEQRKKLGHQLLDSARVVEQILPRIREQISGLIESFYDCRDFLFVGRGLNFPIALEGALKLKEISYIHAEGYAAGELKHGPIALIDKDMPVVAITPKDDVYQKSISNIEEIKARQGRLILFGTEGDQHLKTITEDIIYLPHIHDDLNPILYTIPAQLLSYEIATRRGCDVDQPRNLAKSVTVE
jgi:glucosamine--fructose-6-phosphate aminotransferase (isomerizing)